jgi:hypothetical protein
MPATNDATQGLVFRALTGHSNDYRPMAKPADVIAQSREEPIRLVDLFRKLAAFKPKR